MYEGKSGLDVIPKYIIKICNEKSWQHYICEVSDRELKFERFEDFVAHKLPDGLESSIESVKRLCRDNPEALNKIDEATQKKIGTNQHSKGDNNVNTQSRPVGNSREQALRKLRKDAPEIHKRVLAGELSCHAAMIEAGFRKKKTPFDTAKSAWAKMTSREQKRFLKWVEKEGSTT